MYDNHPGRVEDYTTATLVLLFINMIWIFGAIWASWGLGPVLILAAVLNHPITRLQVMLVRRERRYPARSAK